MERTREKIENVLEQSSERGPIKMTPFILAEIGKGSPLVAVTAATHGDEEIGVHIIDDLKDRIDLKNGTVRLVVANPRALQLDMRFINRDLNRAYPGIEGLPGESGVAAHVLSLVRDADFVVDLHSTSSPSEAFAIVTKRDEEALALAESTRLRKIILISMPDGHAMVDFVKCGIGLELGLHDSQYAYETGMNALENLLGSLELVEDKKDQAEVNHEYFELIGSLAKPSNPVDLSPSFQNFHLVRAGEIIGQFDETRLIAEEDFYPIFIGERAYKDSLCLKVKKISREEFIGEEYEDKTVKPKSFLHRIRAFIDEILNDIDNNPPHIPIRWG